MKKFRSFILSLVAVYVFACGFMYFEQRNIMYVPNKAHVNNAHNAKVAKVTTEDGLTLEGWYFRSADPKAPVIALFHGNAGNIENRVYKAVTYIKEGYGVLLAEYRGYGGNPGKPTEQGFYHDARAYLSWLQDDEGISSEQITLYGESIGTGVAVQMATESNFRGVVLEAPYNSIADVAKIVYWFLPVDLLMKDQFRSINKISNVTEPILFLHGTKDLVIPIRLSKKLYDAANEPKKFMEIAGAGHNNLYKYGAHKNVLKFINEIN